MPRWLRLTLVLALLAAAAAAPLVKRHREGWAIKPEEPLMLSCRAGYAPHCLSAARLYRARGARVEAEVAARWGCELGNPVSCRASGLLLCRELPAAAARELSTACELGDDPSCGTLAGFVGDERYRALVPKHGRVSQAWVGAAMAASASGDRKLAAELAAGNERSLRLLHAAWVIDDGDAEQIDRELVALSESALRSSNEAKLLASAGLARLRGEPMWPAMARDWKELGRPDLRYSELLGVSGMLGDDRTAPCFLSPAFDLRAFEAALSVASDAPLAERLLAYAELAASGVPAVEATRAAAARRRLRASVAPLVGEDLFATVWSMGVGRDELTLADVDALERASAGGWSPPKRALLERVPKHKLDTLVNAVVPSDYAPPYERLKQLADRDPQHRKRIGEVMLRVGDRLVEGGWVLELMMGAAWLRNGARLADSETAARRGEALARRGRSVIGEESPWSMMNAGWPLASLVDEASGTLGEGELDRLVEITREAGGSVEPLP